MTETRLPHTRGPPKMARQSREAAKLHFIQIHKLGNREAWDGAAGEEAPGPREGSEADGVGAPSRVVQGRTGRRRHGPLIPHLLGVGAAPEGHAHPLARLHGQRLL